MEKTGCAHALCFIGNKETGSVLQSLIDKCDLLDAVITDHDGDVFEKMNEINPVVAVIEDSPGKVDGIDLVQKIRRSEESPNVKIPILLVLSHATARRAIEGSESGANQILTAPFSSAKMWECFEQTFNDTRRFVVSEEYVGPERRNISDKKRGHGLGGIAGRARRRGDR